MAENLLHTHSGYAKGAIDKSFLTEIGKGKVTAKSKIDKVRQKEEEMYNQFGCDNYKDFINNIRKIFIGKDAEILSNFEANNLSNSLAKFASVNSELLEQDVKIIVDVSQLDKVGLTLRDPHNKNSKLEFIGRFTMVSLENQQGFKRFLNENFKGRHYVEDSEYYKAVDELLNNKDVFTIKVKKGTESNPRYELYNKSRIANYPWGISEADLKAARNDTKLKKDIQNAIQRIHDFIFYELGNGASKELRTAMTTVWQHNFSKHWDDPARFFAGTKANNFISAVQGTLGEFQSAVFFEYISELGLKHSKIAKISGNIFSGSEQGKTDVQVFKSIGIQVKNFTIIENGDRARTIRDIETNQHPKKFAQYLEENTASNFLNFLANFYFNSSYREDMEGRMNQLEYRLSYWLAEIMNMAIADSTIMDTVSFYMIGGKYLVPCSVLLEANEELGLKNSIEITSSYKGHSDIEYARHTTKPKKDKSGEMTKGVPLYQIYWKKENNQWVKQPQQDKEFENLIGNRIAIRTHFNLFEKIKEYALW